MTIMESEVKTKVCKKCGQELPLDQFHTNDNCKDGHVGTCKKCKSQHDKLRNQLKKESQAGIHKVFVNPDLAKFTPRQLMEELRGRGYSGELKYTQIIKI